MRFFPWNNQPFWEMIAGMSPIAAFDFTDSASLLDSGGAAADIGEAVATVIDKFGGAYTLSQATANFRWVRTATGISPPAALSNNKGLSINSLPVNWRSFSMIILGDRKTSAANNHVNAYGTFLSANPNTTAEIFFTKGGGYLRAPTRMGTSAFHDSPLALFGVAAGASNCKTFNPLETNTHTVSDVLTSTISTILARVNGATINFPTAMPLRGVIFFDRQISDPEIASIIAKSSALNGPQWYFDGDSITFGYTAGTAQASYAGLVADELGYARINYAYPGASSGNLTNLNGGESVNCRNSDNDVVSLLIGANDLATAGNLANLKTNVSNFFANANSRGWAKKIAMTMLPRTAGLTVTAAAFEAERQDFNTWLRTQTFYDSLADLGADANIGVEGASTNLTYFSDGTHPTAAGHRIIADLVKAAVATLE